MEKMLPTSETNLKAEPLEEEREVQRQQRLATLKEIRQAAADNGFGEQTPPHREIEGDRDSDILIGFDTYNRGEFTIRISLDNTIYFETVSYVQVNENERKSSGCRADEMIVIKEKIQEINPSAKIIYRHDGNTFPFPDKMPKHKADSLPEESTPQSPSDQQLHYNPRNGQWYGHPKKN